MDLKRANEDVWVDWPAGDALDLRKRAKVRLGVTVRAAVFARDGYRCQYCGIVCVDAPVLAPYMKTGPWPDNTRTIEHVVPRSRGGQTTLENLVIACMRCNLRKGDGLLEEVGMVLIERTGEKK